MPVEHHLCHIASSYYCSGYEEASFLSIDGMGDFVSTATGSVRGNDFKFLKRVYFPHSLGFFYTAATQYLGFLNYGDEYKVMGLASYGKPNFKQQFKSMIRFKSNGLFELNQKYFQAPTGEDFSQWEQGISSVGQLYSDEWIKLFGPVRNKEDEVTQMHMDIAASAQWLLEETYFHILRQLYAETHCDRLCLSGGVAYNCVANGKITDETPFREIYIPSASGDAGTAVGAGLFEYYRRNPKTKRYLTQSALLGSQYTNSDIEAVLNASIGIKIQKMDEEKLLGLTAQSIVDGAVIGWFQNKMEFGPRALGARSILADPRRSDIKDLLNKKVKFREKFRPFAPMVKEELADKYFEMKCRSSPFMMNVYTVRSEYRSVLAGITHVDNTARVQTVSHSEYPLLWKLLDRMEKLSDVAVLLNTSFNENEPIVNTPQEALDCFLRTQMDYLIIGSYVVSRVTS